MTLYMQNITLGLLCCWIPRVRMYIWSWQVTESQRPTSQYDDSLNVLPKIVKFTQEPSFTELLTWSSTVARLTAHSWSVTLTCRLAQSVPVLKMPEGRHTLYPINHMHWCWPKWSFLFCESSVWSIDMVVFFSYFCIISFINTTMIESDTHQSCIWHPQVIHKCMQWID